MKFSSNFCGEYKNAFLDSPDTVHKKLVLETRPVIENKNREVFWKLKYILKYMKVYMFDIININPTQHTKNA